MRVSNTIKVKDKILSLEDVAYLLDSLESEYKNDKKRTKRMEIVLFCDDGTKYEHGYKDEKISKLLNDILKIKRVVGFEGQYYNLDTGKDIRIQLKESSHQFYSDNSILIKGNNFIWTEGKIKFYQDFLGKVKQQALYINPTISVIQFIVYIMLGYSLIIAWTLLYDYIGYNPELRADFFSLLFKKIPFSFNLIIFVFSFFAGYTISNAFNFFKLDRIRNLFPSIEFNFGRNGKSTKEKVIIIFTKMIELILIPIILWLLTRAQ